MAEGVDKIEIQTIISNFHVTDTTNFSLYISCEY